MQGGGEAEGGRGEREGHGGGEGAAALPKVGKEEKGEEGSDGVNCYVLC